MKRNTVKDILHTLAWHFGYNLGIYRKYYKTDGWDMAKMYWAQASQCLMVLKQHLPQSTIGRLEIGRVIASAIRSQKEAA